MAFIELYKSKLVTNYQFLDKLLTDRGIEWGVVTKVMCGNRLFLREVIQLGTKEVCDSRISNLREIKRNYPDVQTVYIKPPPARSISEVVRYADVSFNTEIGTLKHISSEAVKQQKNHKVIIMIEMGDLREGVLGDELIDFYKQVFQLPGISVVGIGANLNCLNGVMPSQDKLIQLSLYKQLIEAVFQKKIPFVSGGSSVTIPLLFRNIRPKGINHFRIGETLYLGNNLITGKPIKGMNDAFIFHAEIIELSEKPVVPHGETGLNVAGEKPEYDEKDMGKTSVRAILDVGLLDVSPDHLIPIDKAIRFAGASSDMIVVDLIRNHSRYKNGDTIAFRLNYMGLLSVMNSRYVQKVVKE
ncbi:MAG: alanine/ornithine racemase family PLP-dependent enzyme [Bacteroidetes bacterium]|nr:alanine/ornithine racemase family PLP-dependent enzyme [Bacteroidota bacterium]